jgi:sulfatase modifying factor 1
MPKSALIALGVPALSAVFAVVPGCGPRHATVPPAHQGVVEGPGRAPYVQRVMLTDVSFRMVYVPAGTLRREGSSVQSGDVSAEVHVSAFWMGETEVTHELWDTFQYSWTRRPPWPPEVVAADLDRLRAAQEVEPASYGYFGPPGEASRRDQRAPALAVTRHGAREFCRWLTACTGRLYRLPSEIEWEYAARAGTATKYFWGDDASRLAEFAWFGEGDEVVYAHPVAQKQPNPWGLYDVYGNAGEWVDPHWGGFTPRDRERTIGYFIPLEGDEHYGMVRGGTWKSRPEELGSAHRHWQNDSHTSGQGDYPTRDTSPLGWRVGFRIVTPVTEAESVRR